MAGRQYASSVVDSTHAVVRHTGNFEEMIGFCRDGLGMTITERWNRSDSDRRAVLAPAGDVAIATIEVLALGDIAVAGIAPVNIVLTQIVDDARAARKQARDADVEIVHDREDTPWGHRSFGVDEPDGLRIWIRNVNRSAGSRTHDLRITKVS